MFCFALGDDGTRYAWLAEAVAELGYRWQSAPCCSLIALHCDTDAGTDARLSFDGRRFTAADRVLFFGVPSLSRDISASNADFAYSEWRAALEAALTVHERSVVNGAWLLRNFGLRSSDTYWTRRCQLICHGASLQPHDPAVPQWELTVTRKRCIGPYPFAYELETGEAGRALDDVCDQVRAADLDFLRVSVALDAEGRLQVLRASAELPSAPARSFLKALNDFL